MHQSNERSSHSFVLRLMRLGLQNMLSDLLQGIIITFIMQLHCVFRFNAAVNIRHQGTNIRGHKLPQLSKYIIKIRDSEL